MTTPRLELDFYTFYTKYFYTTHFYTCVKLVLYTWLLHNTIPDKICQISLQITCIWELNIFTHRSSCQLLLLLRVDLCTCLVQPLQLILYDAVHIKFPHISIHFHTSPYVSPFPHLPHFHSISTVIGLYSQTIVSHNKKVLRLET